MPTITLMNDVSVYNNEDRASSYIVGQLDHSASDEGLRQSSIIGKYFNSIVADINFIMYSDAQRLSMLLHHIRTRSKDQYLLMVKTQKTPRLRERCFGVLEGTQYTYKSDIFQHSRICAEGGESIAQARDRSMERIQYVCEHKSSYHALIVSHPFICQIICNLFARQKLTRLTNFWLHKGSFATFETTQVGWDFKMAHNALKEQQYRLMYGGNESIYNDLEFTGSLYV